jgi:signal peptidase I
MIKILYYIFGTAVATIALLLIVSAFPIKGNYQVLIVLSGSMEPSIKTGSIVIVKPASQYNVGDVITFGPVSKTKVPITHRIVEMRLQNGIPVYATKGDANEEKDTREVLAREVIGKELFDVPFLGYALAAAKKPIGFGVLIAVPAIIILFDEGKKIFREVGKMRKKRRENKQ